MKESIRLSEKHGLNPSISICFWCGKEKNELLLLGKLKGDMEAPRQTIYNYEPCDECKKNMDGGITVIQVSESPLFEGHAEIQSGVYPTNKWVVITEDGIRKIISDDKALEDVLSKRKCFIDEVVWDTIGLP